MARKRVPKFIRRTRYPTKLEVETLTGETLTATFGMRKGRSDDLMERSPGHIKNGTLYELRDEVSWAPHDDFRQRGVEGLPHYQNTQDAKTEDWKPALRAWADKYNVPHDLVLFHRTGTGHLVALLPVVRQYRMRDGDADRYREPLHNGGFKK